MEQNETQWLTNIYKETFPLVAHMIQQRGGDLDTAKDLFHDALIIYLEKHRNNSLDIHVSASAYLAGITRMLWLKRYRNNKQYVPLDDHLSIPEDKEQQVKPLLHHLRTAGKKCLQLLQAFYYDQRSMQEIAETFHYSSPHSATVQKYKCLEKVREQIKHADIYEETIA
ncbi:RNA polymerase sigma factor [Chitinophaga tropicalis]|uniref:Sigma-70 family RNA polymerase sigma factor n=1 Tax=Chitinophaga tropicalis TaxID=2683588 RepID=A0A7K1U3Q2_9BACT|nr:sigma-70 family RNA polymerase sigma factor [Chitinophaga tropicalis]MVT08978.1 sigma-70 family RNA polymerase sigma factor [Chitinophaga tropicalis]